VRAWHHTYGLPVLTTNCSNNYGPYQFPEKLIPLMILNARAGKPLPVYGDGGNVRDWLYVGDHCRAIARVLEAGRVGEVYNVGGDSERQNIEVVRHHLRGCSTSAARAPTVRRANRRSFVGPPRPRPPLRHRRQQAQAELGWAPARSFEPGIARTVDWYLEHQEWVQRVLDGSYRWKASEPARPPEGSRQ
jgi:dTDP-glucose 4,6-dehydratase